MSTNPARARALHRAALAALLGLMALVLPARAAAAQQPQLSVALSRDAVDLGDSFILQVTIDGASSAETPALPGSDAYQAEFLGGRDESSHSIMTINGRTTESTTKRYVMQWRITPLRAGPGAIEAFSVNAEGKSLRAPRTPFSAAPAGSNPNFRLRLEPEKLRAYVGEPVRVRLVWVLGGGARGAAFTGPDGGRDFDVAPLDPRPPRSRSAPIQNSDPYRVVPFLNGQAVLARSQESLNGRDVPTFSMDLIVTPRREGKLDIGPYRVAFDEITGQKQRSFFDSPFDDLSVTRRSVVSSDAVTLEVRPLPAEGRPQDFAGLIGVYSLEAVAGNTEANVGDPIPLTLTIRGPEPLGSLKPPALDSQPDLAAGFKPSPEGWDASKADDSTPGQRTFATTVRPRSDAVSQIPPIRLPYFDTSSGRYAVALSNAIPLKVHASREFTLADALRPGEGALSPAPASTPATLTSAPPGVGANSESLDALVDQRVSLLGTIQTPGGIAWVILPPAALGVASIIAHRRRVRDPVAAARRRALRDARSRAHAARSVVEVGAALRLALAPILASRPEAITSSDAGHVGTPGTTAAASLLAEIEASAYASQRLDLPRARARAMEVLSELDRP